MTRKPSDPNSTALDYLAKMVGQLSEQNEILRSRLDQISADQVQIYRKTRQPPTIASIMWGSFLGVFVLPLACGALIWLFLISMGVVIFSMK